MSDIDVVRPKGNAAVPSNAPLQPSQAFVDGAIKMVATSVFQLDFSAIGATGTGSTFGTWFKRLLGPIRTSGDLDTANFSGNGFDEAGINAILAACITVFNAYGSTGVTLDLSGGTNAAPSGQGITDAGTLTDNGWTVVTN
jgi:hypothetical protein